MNTTTPRMPRLQKKRGLAKTKDYAERLKEKAAAEAKARRLAERELRVLRRIKFDVKQQPLHVQVSLKLINHTSP